MRFWIFATVLVVVALVITDVSAKKSNRDKRTAKSGKQKQNDYGGSREKEDVHVSASQKKAKQTFNSKDRKRRSIEEEVPKYERNEYVAAAENAKPQEDKRQTKATIEVEQVEQVDHQSGKRKIETNKKFRKSDELRESKEITKDAVGSTEDHVPSSKKSVVKANLKKPLKSQSQEHDVRSSLKKDEEKNKKSRVANKDKMMMVEEADTDEMEKVLEKKKNQKIESTCNDDSKTEEQVEFENSKKCTCNEEDDVQPEEAEELDSCRKRAKSKESKYSERTQKENSKFL